jgi:hypothetical protein
MNNKTLLEILEKCIDEYPLKKLRAIETYIGDELVWFSFN